MLLSVTISNLHRSFGPDLRWMVDLARVADESGIDQIALSDHVLMGERTDRYPYGTFPFAPDEPWMEPLTTLAAIASVTRRVRLATGILIAPLRPPPLLAKTIATLDVLSNGRVDFGVGVGWQREEYEASSVPFEDANAPRHRRCVPRPLA
jgi:alkanesulfonate monooxygenase SsuD/methylene tetrahydromethanopterin reductase-like flavin-dependent oxidoreductase (luciferase family)